MHTCCYSRSKLGNPCNLKFVSNGVRLGLKAAKKKGQTSKWETCATSKTKIPWQQNVLNSILSVSNVPYSSFVPTPVTFLHLVDAGIKQAWLVAMYFAVARASVEGRLATVLAVAVLSVLVLPRRLWQSQMTRLAAICVFTFVLVALTADGVPPTLPLHAAPDAMDDIVPASAAAGAAAKSLTELCASCTGSGGSYSYVIFRFLIFTVTRQSLNLAITVASLTFCALQGASLVLVTTPGEEMAMALERLLSPLERIGVPAKQLSLSLLLSLRFMSLVFEETRNLALGLASRGVDWEAQGFRGTLEMVSRLVTRLFANLFHRSELIAQAMVVRGFAGPKLHRLYLAQANKLSPVANALALLALLAFLVSIFLGS